MCPGNSARPPTSKGLCKPHPLKPHPNTLPWKRHLLSLTEVTQQQADRCTVLVFNQGFVLEELYWIPRLLLVSSQHAFVPNSKPLGWPLSDSNRCKKNPPQHLKAPTPTCCETIFWPSDRSRFHRDCSTSGPKQSGRIEKVHAFIAACEPAGRWR
jgi:hypothetical protein